MVWSEDSPDLFAMMEKGRMYIFRYAPSVKCFFPALSQQVMSCHVDEHEPHKTEHMPVY